MTFISLFFLHHGKDGGDKDASHRVDLDEDKSLSNLDEGGGFPHQYNSQQHKTSQKQAICKTSMELHHIKVFVHLLFVKTSCGHTRATDPDNTWNQYQPITLKPFCPKAAAEEFCTWLTQQNINEMGLE